MSAIRLPLQIVGAAQHIRGGEDYSHENKNFTDYGDMNMRYLRISGVVQRKGRGLIIVPAKHLLAEQLAKDTATRRPIMDVYRELCNGAALPTDNLDTAKALLSNMESQLKANHILYDLSDRPLNTVAEINIACQYLEKLWMDTDELKYDSEQSNQWQEISDYMSLLIDGGGKKIDNDDEDNGIEDNGIEVPKEEDAHLPRMDAVARRIGHGSTNQSSQRGTRFPSGLQFPAGFHSRRRTRRPVLGIPGLHHSDRGHHL